LHFSLNMRYAIRMKASPIRKTSLRQQVYASLLRLMLQNRWAPGERWNDSELAAELDVSRTPVREALIQLETEGLLACDPNRGFYVPALSREEAQEIYPILWSLEQLAVFLCPIAPRELRKRLEQTVGRPAVTGTAADMAAALKQDRAWHLALVEASANSRLTGIYERLEVLTRRYATQLPADAAYAERCAREHGQILEALASEQPARAHALLKIHWRGELESVLRALSVERPAPAGARSAAAGRK
jgi:DNA-binding GntR family transcriptional regulator